MCVDCTRRKLPLLSAVRAGPDTATHEQFLVRIWTILARLRERSDFHLAIARLGETCVVKQIAWQEHHAPLGFRIILSILFF